jgi:micrococcal nuclease
MASGASPVELEKFAAQATAQWTQRRNEIVQYYHTLSPEAHVIGAFLAGVCVGLLIPKLRQPFRRFATVDDIPMKMFHSEQQIQARLVSVSDGDTFRARHVPFFRGVGSYTGKLSENTLQIRLAAIGRLSTTSTRSVSGS